MHYVTKRVKNRTRLTAMLFAMLLLLTGCTVPAEDTRMTAQIIDGRESTASEPESTANVIVQYLPETVSNPDDLPVLKWVLLVDYASVGKAYERAWSAEVAAEINGMLEEKEMPFRLQLVLLRGKGYFVDWFSTPECQEALQDADLLYGYLFPDEQMACLTPITEYVEGENPILQNAVPAEEYWLPYTYGGEIYGVSGELLYPQSEGWSCDAELLEASGLSPEELARDYWDMDAVFPKLLEANGQKTFLSIPEDGYFTNEYAMICLPDVLANVNARFARVTACYAVDYSQGAPTVVNVLDTEYFRTMRVAALRYVEAGYGEDFWHDGVNHTYRLSPSSVSADFCYVDHRGNWRIPVGELHFQPMYSGRVNGITNTTDQKENAAALLQLIAEDAEFRRLLCFGREGYEYTVEDGVYVPNEAEFFYDMRFLSVMSNFSGMETGTYIPKEEGKSLLQTHREMFDRSVLWLPLTVGDGFEISGIMTEIEAVNRVVMNKANLVLTMTEEEYDQFIAEIRTAGGDAVQAELQRQLDVWLAANPGWLPC